MTCPTLHTAWYYLLHFRQTLQVASEFGLYIEDPCNSLGSEKQIEAVLQGAGFKHIKVRQLQSAEDSMTPLFACMQVRECTHGLYVCSAWVLVSSVLMRCKAQEQDLQPLLLHS